MNIQINFMYGIFFNKFEAFCLEFLNCLMYNISIKIIQYCEALGTFFHHSQYLHLCIKCV